MILMPARSVLQSVSRWYRVYLHSYSSDPSMLYYRHMLTLQQEDMHLDKPTGKHWYYLMHNDKLIGEIFLHTEIQHDERLLGELNYVILPEYQHQGFATTAVLQFIELMRLDLGFDGIIASVNVDNAHSIRVLEKAKFKYQNTIEDYYSGFPDNRGMIFVYYFR